MLKLFLNIIEKIIRKVELCTDRVIVPKYIQQRGALCGDNIRCMGFPFIYKDAGASIIIGEHVTLSSRNKDNNHLNLYGPVKIVADRPGAEIVIGDHTRIGGTLIHAYKSIHIGKKCLIAANCQIFDCNGHDNMFFDVESRYIPEHRGPIEAVVIEDCVWIGTGVIILPGVTIGYGSVVAANSVVQRSFPPYSLIAGNPARLISRNDPETLSSESEK